MNRKLTKMLAGAASFALAATGLTGCGSKKGATLEVSLDHSYASTQLIVDGMESLDLICEMGNGLLLSGYDKSYNDFLLLYDLEDGSTKSVQLSDTGESKDSYSYTVASFVDSDGHFNLIQGNYTYSEDDYSEAYEQYIYDDQLNVLSDKDVTESFAAADLWNGIIPGPDGNYYASGYDMETDRHALNIYDSSFRKIGSIGGNFEYIESILPLDDGSLFVTYEDQEWNTRSGIIDTQTKKLEDLEIDGLPNYYSDSFAGQSGYQCFIRDSTAAYGIDLEKGTCEEAVNWINSDFIGSNVTDALQLEDGRFVISVYTDNSSELWMLEERSEEEIKNTTLLSLSCIYMNDNLANAVSKFNRAGNGYRIIVVDYSKYNTDDDYTLAQKQFENDMTSGIVADLICTDSLPYESLANKGLFLDLGTYLEQDGISDADYFMNFFDSLRYGSKLYRMGFSFDVRTLDAKTEFAGTQTGVDLTEFMALIDNMPDGMVAFSDMNRESALSLLCSYNLNSFIDVDNGTCDFTKPEFEQLLELCASYPEEIDYDSMTEDDWNKEYYQNINNEVLFRQAYIYSIRDAYRDQFTYFDKAEVTHVGFPTIKENSNGGRFMPRFTLSISSTSKYAEQGWELMRYMLSEEYQDTINWEIPVSRAAYRNRCEEAMEPETYTDPDGTVNTYDTTVWRGDEEIKIPDVPQEYIDDLTAYIEGITESFYYDETVYDIVSEEAGMYFSGDQDVKAAANSIQSRVSLYLSEQH